MPLLRGRDAARRARHRQSAARALRRAPMPRGLEALAAVFWRPAPRPCGPAHDAARLSPRGLAAGAAAFTIWGLFPLYLHPLREVPALQVIAHRITWSCLFILAWMLLRGELPAPRRHLLPAGAAGAAAADGAAHHRQLAGVRLGRVPRPHRRHQPRLLHQPAGERGAGSVRAARAAEPRAVAGGHARRHRRTLSRRARRASAVDRRHARAELFPLRPRAQGHQRRGAARARHRDAAAAAAGLRLPAVVRAARQRRVQPAREARSRRC